ncbi:hypothetical protein PFISCL1PPCAC_20456, partial [Pristionchus fissidentatus]
STMTTPTTASTAKSTASPTPSSSSLTTDPTPVTTAAATPVSPGKPPAPPSTPSPAPSDAKSKSSGVATTRSDLISFGSLLGPDAQSDNGPATQVSMTSLNETAKSEHIPEEAHEIHCDHLSCYTQTSGTVSYLTADPIPDPVAHYKKKKKPKVVMAAKLAQYGEVGQAKFIVFHTKHGMPLRCKANPKLLKLLDTRQKALRKTASRGHRYFKVTAIRFAPKDPNRRMMERELGVGMLDAQISALTEFMASPLCAHSRMLLKTRFDQVSNTVLHLDIDVIDERGGSREAEDGRETRVPDDQVRADYNATLNRPAVKCQSLASVLSECEASTDMKAHDVAFTKPISARPAPGMLKRLYNRMTSFFG